LPDLVTQAKTILGSSRRTAQLARSRISGSRERLAQSGNNIVAAAAQITEARSTLCSRQPA
jgi:hypothetical protein